ncbi:MAG: IncI1 plasmid conjugative transfer DNA primase [uncultured Paraburkholderia sp.]|nr:MAG: IncI1 plasmid conjugative transfer DNA primase [uncultured Paraburkholderia sp.]CAH2940092.1 MAG: IncI1 plasmid conjugative transfer DNA primase [uncultured Paraburkholderia sp.]
MPGDRHDLAADDIFQNISANVSYAEILQSIDSEIVDRVKTLSAENERKVAEKEERKARDNVNSRAALLAEQQAALRIAVSFKDAGRVPDAEWARLGRAVDRVYLGGDRADLGAALELATTMARVDTTRPCPFPESVVQRAFEGERAYQASRTSANHEQVIADWALRAGNEGDPAPRYVLERREAVEHYAFGLELRLEALRAANADAFALRDTQDLLAAAHARAKSLASDNAETATAEKW